MSKLLILTLLASMLVTEEGMFNTSQEEANNKIEQTVIQSNVVVVKNNKENKNTEVKKDDRPEAPNVPLNDKLLDYIYKKSKENELDYFLILAIMKVESNFDPNTRSKTGDYGLAQINRNTAKWIAKELGLKNYDLKNPYTSTDFSIFYLSYLRDKYKQKGLSEEDTFDYVVISYNRGEGGARKYIRKHGVNNNTYWKKVMKAKEELERSVVNE